MVQPVCDSTLLDEDEGDVVLVLVLVVLQGEDGGGGGGGWGKPNHLRGETGPAGYNITKIKWVDYA